MELSYYLYHFARLNTAKCRGKKAPHKAVLLIAIMRLVELNVINCSEIELTDELINEFKSVWTEKVPSTCPFTCDITKPYFHMQHEPFWQLLEHKDSYSSVEEELGLYTEPVKSMASSYSVGSLRNKFRCAKIDKDLYEIFQDSGCRKKIEELLVSTYMVYDNPTNKPKVLGLLLGASICIVAA